MEKIGKITMYFFRIVGYAKQTVDRAINVISTYRSKTEKTNYYYRIKTKKLAKESVYLPERVWERLKKGAKQYEKKTQNQTSRDYNNRLSVPFSRGYWIHESGRVAFRTDMGSDFPFSDLQIPACTLRNKTYLSKKEKGGRLT